MLIRNSIVVFFLALSFTVEAEMDGKLKAEAEELIREYEAIFSQKKYTNIDKVFTEEYLKSIGGKEAFIKNVEAISEDKKAKNKNIEIYVHEGMPMKSIKLVNDSKNKSDKKIEEVYFATFRYSGTKKAAHNLSNWFALKRDDKGHLRIRGTISPEGEK